MAVLSRYIAFTALLASVAAFSGCGGGSLTTAATEVVDTQRRANLTRDKLTGTWDGEVTTPDGVGRQTVVMEFAQGTGFTLDGSILIGSDIRIGRAAVRDTFAMVNGVFKEGDIRFNLANSVTDPVIVSGGSPVLFIGILTENGYMSGQMQAGGVAMGYWEALLRTDTTPAEEPPAE